MEIDTFLVGLTLKVAKYGMTRTTLSSPRTYQVPRFFVEISTILHINTLYYTYHLIHSSSLTMQLKVKLEMHLNAGMNASLLLIVDIELIF